MGVVGPIKSQEDLNRMKEYLRDSSIRNYLIFKLGINLGLPINELLNLRVEDVLEKKEILSGNYQIRINELLQYELSFYIGERKSGYLFRSKGEKPLSRFQLYNILKDAADAAELRQTVGALTLRKTFAYWAYQSQSLYLPLLSKYLKHHTVSHTLRYIEIGPNENLSNICLPELNL